MKEIFSPFGSPSKITRFIITTFWILCALFAFEVFHSKIIPSPSKVIHSIGTLLSSNEFYEDLVSSLLTTVKAMFYSVFVTMVIVYAGTIEAFRPIADFVSKCRYLTLTGLVFVFTMLSSNLGELKIYLLVFGITPFFVTSFLSVVRSTPKEEIWKAYVNKGGRWSALWEVIIVGKMDMLFEVMRQNFAISWMMITMVEGYAMNEGGIGTLLIKSNKYLNLANVFAMLFIVLMLGLLFDYALSALRNMLFPYIKSNKK